MSKKSQKKGRRGEIELAGILRGYGIPAFPGQPMSYGGSPDIVGVDGIHCEVKRCEQLRLSDWMRQSARDSERFGDGLPTLFHRKNGEDWIVTMRLTDWLLLYQAYSGEDYSGNNQYKSGINGDKSGNNACFSVKKE